MTKPVWQMSDKEFAEHQSNGLQQQVTPPDDIEDLYSEDEELETPGWHRTTKEREHFLASKQKVPRSGIMGMFSKTMSVDDPSIHRELPLKKVKWDEAIKVSQQKRQPQQEEVLGDADEANLDRILSRKNQRSILGDVLTALYYIFTIVPFVIVAFLEYTIIQTIRAPPVEVTGLVLMTSIQVSLVAFMILVQLMRR
jgi:hypothetical protein